MMERAMMSSQSIRLAALPICAAVFLSASDQPWKDKKVPDWTQEDAKLVLESSPWAKSVKAQMSAPSSNSGSRPGGGGMGRGGGGMGRGGSIGFPGGGGIGFPGGGGMGGRRGGGGGYPGGGGQRGDRQDRDPVTPPALSLRWESALPVREAELKTRDQNAPMVDETHYAIALYGVPRRMVPEDSKNFVSDLKKHAGLKRESKKELKPSSVEVVEREDGPVIVFLFPRSTEITKQDRRIEFDAQVGRLKIAESFFTEDMVYDGKLEI